MKITTSFFLGAVLAAISVRCKTTNIDGNEKTKLPEFLSELDPASLVESEEDVDSLKDVVKRLAPQKNGEYQVYQVFFGNEDLLKEWIKGADVSGQPGVDFPALTSIPATSFTCKGFKGGYFADLETNCQVFHICENGRKISFLCPNGTIFQQSQLICDWWFKVDCSKSVELYEQSAEQFAEEERRRAEFKKMNSEFRRDNLENQNSYENTEYDGRQNGRVNIHHESSFQNQIQDQQDTKSRNQASHQNSYFNNNRNTVSKTSDNGQYEQNYRFEPSTTTYPTTYRQQNQLDQREKSSHQSNLDREANKFSGRVSNYLKQGTPFKGSDYYSAVTNGRKEDELNNPKTPSFTRNNFNSPSQRVTPSYTETTTFRTSTANPNREYQELAESASFGQGMRYNKAFSSSNFNTYYNNRAPSISGTPAPLKNRERYIQATTKKNIPQFPETTYTPIFKPRIVSTTSRNVKSQKNFANTNFNEQSVDKRKNTAESVTRASYVQNYQTTNQKSTESLKHSSVDATTTNKPTQFFKTTASTASQVYNTQNDYRTSAKTTSAQTNPYNNQDLDNRFNKTYTNSPSTSVTASVAQGFNSDRKTTTRNNKSSTQSVSSTRQNNVAPTTEKPTRSTNAESSKQPTPSGKSVNYQNGKASSTTGLYTSFTKNYVPSSTASSFTQRSPVYTATVPTNQNKSTTRTTKNGSNTGKATYLPRKTTIPVSTAYTTPKPLLGNRSPNEREHALRMLQSLQGLQGAVPSLANARGGNNPRLTIPSSSESSALHSLALYFANAANISNGESVDYQNDGEDVVPKKENASTELPTSILTRHTIKSYVELFNLNNALEYNSTMLEESDENEDYSDLELQQSAGPLNGGRKSNGTKLRELAQVFTQALSAYLQDPETFKQVLTDIRPTEPPNTDDQFPSTTVSMATTEEYPSVTKEKDEVLDFSDDVNGARRRQSLTTVPPETTRQPFYTTRINDYFTDSETQYSTSPLSTEYETKDIAHHVNSAFDSTDANYITEPSVGNNLGGDYENYYPSDTTLDRSKEKIESYGKYVKPFDATPISDNYVASSTPASYDETETLSPVRNDFRVGKLQQDLEPPASQIKGHTSDVFSATAVTTDSNRDRDSTTPEPFMIRYFDTTQINDLESRNNVNDESLIPANSQNPSYNINYNAAQETDKHTNLPLSDPQENNNHWTSSPSVTQLWESTVFLDPQHINQGLVTDSSAESGFSNGIEYRTPLPKDETPSPDIIYSVTPRDLATNASTWQWPTSTDDTPTVFTLLTNTYSSENTATPTPATDGRTSQPQKYSLLNVTENEITKAHEMFGKLNQTSSSKLMKVMEQAENNVTVRQLVLLLISHCDGPINKTMEEEKEELLSALLRLPVHEFSSAESTEIIKGISRITLPLGRSKAQFSTPTTPTEPSVTTYRSGTGRRQKSTTKGSTSRRNINKASLAESRNSVTEESDSRALELLRSLYSIAAKWG